MISEYRPMSIYVTVLLIILVVRGQFAFCSCYPYRSCNIISKYVQRNDGIVVECLHSLYCNSK